MNAFSNINLQIPDMWEVRDVINKVKNVVLNYTEMEAKVHDATNNEAWGASSTVMQEIAQATFNYQYFNEIMPTIYKRFTEKEAKQWRQIYKSLVLLEYLVKNGSERVVDDARSHVSMIKMMKNFHYVDEKGKDQGLNVRNRAKELAELLGDVDLIKAERKKAKKNRNKYTGVGSEGGMMFASGGGYSSGGLGSGSSSMGGGSRYEGFGSDSNYSSGGGGTRGFGSDDYNSTSYGNGGYGNSSDFFDDERPGRYDDDDSPSNSSQRRGSKKSDSFSSSPGPRRASNAKSTSSASKPKTAKEMNLFDFDEPAITTTSSTKKANDDDWGDFAEGDDDFDDFQSAPTNTQQQQTASAPPPKTAHTAPKKSNDIFDLLGDDSTFTSSTTSSPVIPQQQQTQPHNLMLSQGISFDSLVTGNSSSAASSPAIQPMHAAAMGGSGRQTPVMQQQQKQPSTDNTAIGGMWSQASISLSLDSLGSKQAPAKPAQGPSMNALKNNSVNAGWNNWASANTSQPQQPQQSSGKQSSAFDDLLF
ncbi:ENTH-domain-containing protein [Mucor ambiguus]|uniref:ENTH-domain-containing protein n=1 Tax=Mucor ambiguus TaxID=91626 RepID=A0A0C9N774_9FUNG|nr:ENTH-domain-containing protein [Mucor ambiguus]